MPVKMGNEGTNAETKLERMKELPMSWISIHYERRRVVVKWSFNGFHEYYLYKSKWYREQSQSFSAGDTEMHKFNGMKSPWNKKITLILFVRALFAWQAHTLRSTRFAKSIFRHFSIVVFTLAKLFTTEWHISACNDFIESNEEFFLLYAVYLKKNNDEDNTTVQTNQWTNERKNRRFDKNSG